MKLGTRLLLPSIVTALVALAGGALNGFMMSRDAARTASANELDLDNLRTITDTQHQMGQMHAGVYRTVPLISSLDEAAITAARAAIPEQVKGMQRVISAISEQHADNAALRASATDVASKLTAYVK